MPSNRIVSMRPHCIQAAELLPPPVPRGLLGSRIRIVDLWISRELDIVELAVLLLDLAHVDVLHDVAGIRIDSDRPAGADEFHAFHGFDELGAISIAASLF